MKQEPKIAQPFSHGADLGERAAKLCIVCGERFGLRRGRVARAQRFCSRRCKGIATRKRVTKTCPICGKDFSFHSSGKRNNEKRRFCSCHCAAVYRYQLPGRRELFEAAIGPKRGTGHIPGQKNPRNAENMRRIWADPAYRARVLPNYQGKTFLSRGGNGQPTEPQMLVARLTGLPMEHAIPTKPVEGLFPSLPHCYKVDLAHTETRTAIEIDGKSHNTTKWRFLDRRKTEILEALGWMVIRFTNEEVRSGAEAVAARIMDTIALRSGHMR